MKASWCFIALSLISTALSAENDTSPFYPPKEAQAETNRRAHVVLQVLNKRVANNCPSGYNPCSNLNNLNICCKHDSRCSRDAADNIACCPTGASCTGNLAATTSTSSFMFPQYATASATDHSTCGPVSTGSTLSGPYPFISVPTTFSDAATCSSYYSRCETDYTRCTSSLGNGGQYGVTVAGDGGAGVTVQGGGATPVATVCSSLRLDACHGLNLGYCNSYHNGQDGESGASSFASAGRVPSLQDLVFGVTIGAAGMFI